jgi:hypothetical protein
MEVFPKVWSFFDGAFKAGEIGLTRRGYQEIQLNEDDLAAWCKVRKSGGLCLPEGSACQQVYSQIADYVMRTYPQHHAAKFLSGADGWIIAQAAVGGGIMTVVTEEVRSKDVPKIPDVAKQFAVKTINTIGLFGASKFTL